LVNPTLVVHNLSDITVQQQAHACTLLQSRATLVELIIGRHYTRDACATPQLSLVAP